MKGPLLEIQVSRDLLFEQVADQIQNIIVKGGLVPGDRLPPERELAEQLHVSRTVIREAVKALQERGLVRVLRGSGTYVSRVEPDTIAQSITLYMHSHQGSLRDLVEIRCPLEIEIAGLAAEMATDEDIELLESSLREMEEALPQLTSTPHALEQFVQADMIFHHALARATKNVLLPVLLTPITDLLLEFRRKASDKAGAAEDAIYYHRAMLDAIRRRDGLACRELMRKHLYRAEQWTGVGGAPLPQEPLQPGAQESEP
jgi:GntR family transcriptional repressor for pyruvate dehydrogenase complex